MERIKLYILSISSTKVSYMVDKKDKDSPYIIILKKETPDALKRFLSIKYFLGIIDNRNGLTKLITKHLILFSYSPLMYLYYYFILLLKRVFTEPKK